jgi:RNA recognition motif-containing protein
MSQENKIYVGNLDYSVKDEDLKSFLEEKGIAVKDVKIIQDKYLGRSKGFGFVEVESEDILQKAIEALDGKELKGRAMKANKARPPREKDDSSRDRYPRH